MPQKGFAHSLVLFIILIGIVVGVYLVKHPTIFRPHADESPVRVSVMDTDGNVVTETQTPHIKLQISYVPLDQNFGTVFNNSNLIQDTNVYVCPGKILNWTQIDQDLHGANLPPYDWYCDQAGNNCRGTGLSNYEHNAREFGLYHSLACRTATPPKPTVFKFGVCFANDTVSWSQIDQGLKDFGYPQSAGTYDAKELGDYQKYVCSFLLNPQPSDLPTNYKVANDLASLDSAPIQLFNNNNIYNQTQKIIDWNLVPGVGQRTVYVQLKINLGWTDPVATTIDLVNPPPDSPDLSLNIASGNTVDQTSNNSTAQSSLPGNSSSGFEETPSYTGSTTSTLIPSVNFSPPPSNTPTGWNSTGGPTNTQAQSQSAVALIQQRQNPQNIPQNSTPGNQDQGTVGFTFSGPDTTTPNSFPIITSTSPSPSPSASASPKFDLQSIPFLGGIIGVFNGFNEIMKGNY